MLMALLARGRIIGLLKSKINPLGSMNVLFKLYVN